MLGKDMKRNSKREVDIGTESEGSQSVRTRGMIGVQWRRSE